MPEPYNPLDKLHLAESIARAMVEQPVYLLPPEKFVGAGVYALYYTGRFPCYEPVAHEECDTPIYVGIALPEGGRTGGAGITSSESTTTSKLAGRLKQHARSIEQAENLELSDFRCRYLLLDDIWIPLAEQYLIQLYRPVWNTSLVSGFGIHAPGKGRKDQARSLWDELHPGRGHAAERPAATMTADEIQAKVSAYLRGEEEAAIEIAGIVEAEEVESAPEAD